MQHIQIGGHAQAALKIPPDDRAHRVPPIIVVTIGDLAPTADVGFKRGSRRRFPRFMHRPIRSEEHTSELQSPCNLVYRLLLEKKNTAAWIAAFKAELRSYQRAPAAVALEAISTRYDRRDLFFFNAGEGTKISPLSLPVAAQI